MKTMIFLSVLAALSIAACAPASNPADQNLHRQSGSWTMTQYTVAYDANGTTGDMADMVKAGQASVGQKELDDPVCLSAATVAKDDLKRRLAEAIQLGPEWKTAHSTIKYGKVDFEATMNDPAQGKAKMTITGTLSPTITDLIVTTDGTLPAPLKTHIHTVMKTENRWVGNCT